MNQLSEKKERHISSKSIEKKRSRKPLSPQQQKKKQLKLQQQRRKKQIMNVSLGVLVLFSLLFLLNIRTHYVDGESMMPTLQNKDKLLIFKTQKIDRYAIVTLKPKNKPNEMYIKRVIGMPGDVIWLDKGDLYINHQIQKKPSSLKEGQLPDGTIKVNIDPLVSMELSAKEKIPDDYYFVMGDNRNNSLDSRKFGLVNKDQIEGKLALRYTPINKFGFVN
ncbi:signal peptidase I [Enterococcus quebecensis]|uniref:Signal peptidase I n=1 Tax=Enterococcus quebecensis TaxID=903983 RepID=A0A1E5GTS7_9ENTE|nr:signal peptidase I [Enterococcus quebecensis]